MKPTGWDNGLNQDYSRALGRWFADRLGARYQLRIDMIRMNPAHDVVHLAGQVRENVLNQDKPLSYMIDDFKRCLGGYEKHSDGCCHKTVIERCKDCSFNKECQHEWIMESPYNKQERSFCKKCNALKRLTKD